MKSKRQTVWLVSMLSLMVVLSAYYLFTEDSSTRNQSATGEQVSSINNEKTPETAANDEMLQNDDVVLTEIMAEDGKTEVVSEEQADGTASQNSGDTADAGGTAGNKEAADEAKADTGAPDASGAAKDAASGTKEGAPAPKDNAGNKEDSAGSAAADKDEDVLKQLESQGKSAADSLTAYQFQRSEQNAKKQDELMQTINDGNKSLDEAAMAQQELSALEERQEKIYDIEERLQQTYANAVVTESEDKYKVLVVSEKLEAKDAVNIMDLVIKELGVSQDKVSVQYVTQ